MSRLLPLAWASLSLFFLGCATTGDLRQAEERLQSTLQALQAKQTKLHLELSTAQTQITKIDKIFSSYTKEGRVNFAEMDSKLDELRRDHQQLVGRFQGLKLEYDKLKEQHDKLFQAYSKTFGDPTKAPAEGSQVTIQEATPQSMLTAAKALFTAGKFEAARDQLKEMVKRFPKDERTDEGFLLLGDSYFQLKNFVEASVQYTKIRKDFPQSKVIDTAFFKLSQTYFQLKDCKLGLAYLKQLVKKYPDSSHNDEAKAILRKPSSHCK